MANPAREARKELLRNILKNDPKSFRSYAAGLSVPEKIEVRQLIQEIIEESAQMPNPAREARKRYLKNLFESDPEAFHDYSAGLSIPEKIESLQLLHEIMRDSEEEIKADLLAGAPVEAGEFTVYLDEHGELIITERKNIQ